MRSLFGLKNMIMFSTILLTIGSVSAQQAFAGVPPICSPLKDGSWDDSSTWQNCGGSVPGSSDDVVVFLYDITVTGNEQANNLQIAEGGSLLIDCDASLNLFSGQASYTNVTNHGTFTSETFDIFGSTAHFFNSGDYSGVTTSEGGSIVEISSICDRPIGGTVGSMDTMSLIIAGSQTNMGWWAIALVGAVATGAGIVFKTRSNKTEE